MRGLPEHHEHEKYYSVDADVGIHRGVSDEYWQRPGEAAEDCAVRGAPLEV